MHRGARQRAAHGRAGAVPGPVVHRAGRGRALAACDIRCDKRDGVFIREGCGHLATRKRGLFGIAHADRERDASACGAKGAITV